MEMKYLQNRRKNRNHRLERVYHGLLHLQREKWEDYSILHSGTNYVSEHGRLFNITLWH
jgi:hypothetical protein